jgi:hypothetical protein
MSLTELDLDGRILDDGSKLIGKAKRQPDGTWQCLASVAGALCVVQVRVMFEDPPEWAGDPTYERFKRLELD